MNAETIITTIWTAINSPAAISVFAGAVLWLLNKVYAAKPAWKQYEGAIISGIKFAEKNIPNNTENAGLKRLDCALQYVLQVYAETEGKAATPAVIAEIKDAIPQIHVELESDNL